MNYEVDDPPKIAGRYTKNQHKAKALRLQSSILSAERFSRILNKKGRFQKAHAPRRPAQIPEKNPEQAGAFYFFQAEKQTKARRLCHKKESESQK